MSARTQAATAALSQTAYHRDHHRAWRRVALVLAMIAAVEGAALAGYIWHHATVYVIVAATPDGRVIEMTPLDEPIMSDAALRNWTVSAVTEAFTLGHHDWRMRLADVRQYFTGEGYDGYLKALDDSLFLNRIRENLQVAAAVATGTPVIVATRIFGDRAAWSIEFPMLVTFQAGSRINTQRITMGVLVMRVPLSENASGIGIQQMIATRTGA